MEEYKVSIIMPTYNNESTIKRAIDSVISQTYSNWELLICNDASTDNTVNIVNSIKDERITLVNNDVNKGSGYSRKRLIKLATGDYIAFLDGDDTFNQDFLKTFVQLSVDNDADIVKGGMNVYENGKLVFNWYDVDTVLTNDFKFSNGNNDNRRFIVTGIYRKKLFKKASYSTWRMNEDSLTHSKVAVLANKIVCSSYVGYNVYKNKESVTAQSEPIRFQVWTALCYIELLKWLKKNKIDSTVFNINGLISKVDGIKATLNKNGWNLKYSKEIIKIFKYLANNKAL